MTINIVQKISMVCAFRKVVITEIMMMGDHSNEVPEQSVNGMEPFQPIPGQAFSLYPPPELDQEMGVSDVRLGECCDIAQTVEVTEPWKSETTAPYIQPIYTAHV